MKRATTVADIEKHLLRLKACAQCPAMIGPVVTPRAILSPVYLVGQAPGPREGEFGRPFAWTAGKNLFKWFSRLGVDEEQFRSHIYMSAVCRCFPGKTKQGGDRVPTPAEVKECARWMRDEVEMLHPQLIIPVGKLAIEQFLPGNRPLNDVIGQTFVVDAFGRPCDAIPLPHPSGASTWFHREPGKTLLGQALELIGQHPAWRQATADLR